MNAKALAAVALSFVAVSAFAADGKLTPVATSQPLTVGQAMQRLGERTRAARGGVRPNVIIFERRSSAFLIPAAGSVTFLGSSTGDCIHPAWAIAQNASGLRIFDARGLHSVGTSIPTGVWTHVAVVGSRASWQSWKQRKGMT